MGVNYIDQGIHSDKLRIIRNGQAVLEVHDDGTVHVIQDPVNDTEVATKRYVDEHGGGGGGGGGQSYLLTYYENSVTLDNGATSVAIGIPQYERSKDLLIVHKNQVFLKRDEVYTVSADGLSIEKIDKSTPWVAPDSTFNFLVLKNVASPDVLEYDGILLKPGSVSNDALGEDIKIGSLAELTTENKTSVVAATNEINEKLSTLEVVVIDEAKKKIDEHASDGEIHITPQKREEWDTVTEKAELLHRHNKSEIEDMPTKLSDFENDLGVGPQQDSFSMTQVVSTFVATSDNTTHCLINNDTYNKDKDILTVYFKNMLLYSDVNYTINVDGKSIDLTGWTINTGDEIRFIVWKSVKDYVDTLDMSLIENGSIEKEKLSVELQGKIDKIGEEALQTAAKNISGAVNENLSNINALREVLDNLPPPSVEVSPDDFISRTVVERIAGPDKDLNDYTKAGFYIVKPGVKNYPSTLDSYLLVYPWDNNKWSGQMVLAAAGNTTNSIFYRHSTSADASTWSTWSRVVLENSITQFDKIGAGNITPGEALDVSGNARIRQSGSLKFGGTGANDAAFEIKYNSTAKALDFNCLI